MKMTIMMTVIMIIFLFIAIMCNRYPKITARSDDEVENRTMVVNINDNKCSDSIEAKLSAF